MSTMLYYDDPPDGPVDPREQAFHNMVRELVVFLLIFLILYGLSYGIVSAYKRKKEDVRTLIIL